VLLPLAGGRIARESDARGAVISTVSKHHGLDVDRGPRTRAEGEASHELSLFLCFGKEGALRGREFGDQLHTFSCLSVLHNAVVGLEHGAHRARSSSSYEPRASLATMSCSA
jgi:hypothetical protein